MAQEKRTNSWIIWLIFFIILFVILGVSIRYLIKQQPSTESSVPTQATIISQSPENYPTPKEKWWNLDWPQ